MENDLKVKTESREQSFTIEECARGKFFQRKYCKKHGGRWNPRKTQSCNVVLAEQKAVKMLQVDKNVPTENILVQVTDILARSDEDVANDAQMILEWLTLFFLAVRINSTSENPRAAKDFLGMTPERFVYIFGDIPQLVSFHLTRENSNLRDLTREILEHISSFATTAELKMLEAKK